MSEPFIPDGMPAAIRKLLLMPVKCPFLGVHVNISMLAILWAKNGGSMLVDGWGCFSSSGPFGGGLEQGEALTLMNAEAFISGVISALEEMGQDPDEIIALVTSTLHEEALRMAPEEFIEDCVYCPKARGKCPQCSKEVLFFGGEAQEHALNGEPVELLGLCPGSLRAPDGEVEDVCDSRHPERRGLRCHKKMGHEGEHCESPSSKHASRWA